MLIIYLFCLPRKLFNVPYSSVVTDRNGELLGARIATDEQWRFPPTDTVPEKFAVCLTEFEDQYFRYHWGVNPLAIGRALIQNIKEKKVVSGGSTITMQVIRLSRNKPRTIPEKIWEIILATRLEFRYSKEEILALYASHAPFGGNVVGLNAAAWRYFGHPANHLSWAETATLAVLPNSPGMLHLTKNRDALLNKRNRLLKKLFEKGHIDTTTYELALSENLPDEPIALPQIAPHLVTRLSQTHQGEYCISTIDISIQRHVEQILKRWNNEFAQYDIHNIAAIVIEIPTNQVIAYCGNVDSPENYSANQVDIIKANRSTGSILKPFLYYIMLEEGEILPHTLFPDIPTNINGFSPQNFNLQFEGAVKASNAVSRSLNIPLVHMLKQHGVPQFYDFLKENKIADLPFPASHYGLSLILGGAEARLGDVSNAYANMGRALLGLNSSTSTVLLNDKPSEIKPGFQPGAVWQVFEVLKEVNRPEEIDWRTIPSMQHIAWKTGTSYGFRDAWAVGVTPRYVVGVWAGNASGEGKPHLTGARTAGPVMFDIFHSLPQSSWFEQPQGEFTEAVVCKQSGQLKGRFCQQTDTVLILPNGLRTSPCPYHIQVNLTPDKRFQIYEHCMESEAAIRESWFVLPPAWAWYYRQHHPEYKSLPPFKTGCGANTSSPMQFIYPQGNADILLPRQLDGSPGSLTIELAHNNRKATVFWHMDNSYITSTQDFHKLTIIPSPGTHTITAVDQDGNSLSCTLHIL